MSHLAPGLLLAALTFAVHAAEPEQDIVALRLDLLSIQAGYGQTENPRRRLTTNRLIAGFELTDVPVAPVNGFITSATMRGNALTEPKKETVWAARNGWQIISGDSRPALSALLRFGSPGNEIRIRPRRHSLSIEYLLDFD
jgi:hypothetical protein